MAFSLERLDPLIPPQHHRTPSTLRKARLLVLVALGTVPIHTGYALFALALAAPGWWLCAVFWVLCYGIPVALLWPAPSTRLPANVLTGAACLTIVGQAAVTGGITAPGLTLLPLLPLLAATMADFRSGVGWAVAAAAVVGTLLAAGPLPTTLRVEPVVYGVVLLIALVMSMGLLWLDGQSRDRVEGELREASAARARFLTMMSHEIRTPMNGVLGMVQLLDETPLTEEQREYVSLLRTSGASLMDLLNDILDLSKLEAGRVELEAIPLALPALLDQVTRLVEPLALEKGLALTLRVDESVPAWVRGDPARLRQVVLNLLSNAIKFTEQGSVSVEARAVGGERLEITVEDTGIGIAPEQQARLFEPFTQASADTTRRFGGTGLGLAISRQLIEQMMGQIVLDSVAGAGSCFTIVLPLCPALAPAPEVLPVCADLSGCRVLLAEDNPINQRLMVRLLEKMGAAVTLAGDGAAATSCWRPGMFDFVLMDVEMPEMDGLAATRAIRSAEPGRSRVPILALTANTSAEIRQACAGAGMDEFLSKPLQKHALLEALQRVEEPARAASVP